MISGINDFSLRHSQPQILAGKILILAPATSANIFEHFHFYQLISSKEIPPVTKISQNLSKTQNA